ncbi:MAG: carbamoyltransferase HypF, partial [Terriglobales bacterium]
MYAFTNCTNCGPRYTISIRLPYDRCNTTLAGFALCAACAGEYDAPGNRRFHAQPNACPDCGPELSCGERRGEAALAWVRRQLRSGAVVALKNVGGYQLACDARCQAAVERLRRSKRRPRKPFALLARDLASAERCCQVDEIEGRALLEAARPIVLLAARGDPPGVAAAVAPGQRRLGVMLPSSPLHELLFATAEPAPPLLVMTSGNRGALPMAASEEQARQQLGGIADCFLDHNRAIARPVDDSVGSCFEGRLRLWRRARGYVPLAIELGGDGPTVLAAGADLKNTFCLARGSEGFLSPHIGDLENDETAAYYSDTLNRYLEMLGARPQAVAHDPHPGYHVSRMARRWAADHDVRTLIAVQHHHAHIASCMADNGVQGEVLGVAFDGTGYGEDGTVWGGEFLWASYTGFRRGAHLRPVRLWGGDRAVREPWRAGLAWLVEAFGPEAAAAAAALWPAMEPAQRTQLRLGLQVLQRPGLTFWCSAAGRLFDAVAAMVGLAPPGHEASFEGEAGLALENAATAGCGGCAAYPFSLSCGQPAAVDLRPTIRAIAADRRGGTGIETIAGRFHQTMADIIGTTCRHLWEERWRSGGALETPARVCLSGGVFQNELLLAAAAAQLRASGFEVLIHTQVPANDGGLALGQAVVARARLPRPPPTGTRLRRHGRPTIDERGPLPLLAETLAAPRPHSKGGAGPGPVSPR